MDINQLGNIPKEKLARIKNSWDIAVTHKPIEESIKTSAALTTAINSVKLSKAPSEMSA